MHVVWELYFEKYFNKGEKEKKMQTWLSETRKPDKTH